MRLIGCMAMFLLIASSVRAQDDDPESGLVDGRLIGDPSPVAAPQLRPQLVTRDHTTIPIIGGVAAVTGGITLIISWSLYVARQNFRLRPWHDLSNETIDTWETLGAASLWTGVAASSLLITGEYMLFPEEKSVPMLGWFAGAGGLALAAVGVGFWAGGEACAPQAIRPGADIKLACSAGTADRVFGPLLVATALPILNIPLVWLFRKAFAGAPESLSVGPRGVVWTGRF